jgi:hypothetical protein
MNNRIKVGGFARYQLKTAVVIVALLLSIVPTHADQHFWCLDEGSAGYGFDPKRPVFDDKSKPQNFMRTRTALRLTEQNAYLNFQGLGEKEFSCSAVHDDIIHVSVRFSSLFSIRGYIASIWPSWAVT